MSLWRAVPVLRVFRFLLVGMLEGNGVDLNW
jgi:hypothetical protein